MGEGKYVQGVSVAKTPYLSHALPVPGLECGTWTPVPGLASGPGLGRGGVLERPVPFFRNRRLEQGWKRCVMKSARAAAIAFRDGSVV